MNWKAKNRTVWKICVCGRKSMDLVGSEKTKSVSLIIADPDSDMTPFVNLHTEKEYRSHSEKGEAVIPQKVADETWDKDRRYRDTAGFRHETISVTVSGLCENFVYNYVYLSADTYEEQMKTEPEYKKRICVVFLRAQMHICLEHP